MIRTVRLIPSSVFVKDPKDVWGKETTIGLAEHAARLGSPMTYDRRGDILWYDGFENNTKMWVITGGGSVNRSTDYSVSGAYSYKLTTPSVADQNTGIFTVIEHPVVTTRIGHEIAFTKHDDHKYIELDSEIYDGSYGYISKIRIDVQNNKLQYYGSDLSWHDIASGVVLEDDYGGIPVFYSMKYVIDLSTQKYVRCLLANTEYDMSNYSFYYGATGAAPQMRIVVLSYTNVNSAIESYVDRIIITRNEPE